MVVVYLMFVIMLPCLNFFLFCVSVQKRENYMNYQIIVQQSSRKSSQTALAEEYAQEIEDKEGRQKMEVRLESGFSNCK